MKNLKYIILGIISIPLGGYLINFFGHKISNSPSDWGVFGDFLGGTLNPLLTIVNIWVLWHLTKEVAKQDSQMALNQFQFDFYQKVKNTFDQFNEESPSYDKIEGILVDINSLKDYTFLFQEIEKVFLDHFNLLDEALKRMRDNYRDIIYDNVSYKNRDTTIFDNAVDDFRKQKANFLKLLQKTMIG